MRLARIIPPLMQVAILTLLIIKGVSAGDVHVIGSLKHSIIQQPVNSSVTYSESHNTKIIQLLKIELSDEAKKLLTRRTKYVLTDHSKASHSLLNAETPQRVQLAMNHVPVLDQGTHGTCITFAITGALDAVIGKGDYISQLCHLQLGNYLEKHGYALSGWDGNYPIAVINQIEQYGIVNQEKQTTIGCGGLTEYPTYSNKTPESFIDPEQYNTMNELIFGKTVNWSNIYWRLSSTWTLNEVKEALISGDRSVFAVVLPRIELGVVGAVGNYKTKNDTWLLTSDVLIGLLGAQAAHGMIITGYDDNAVAIDNYGKEHTGLLTLRNSWGNNFGNNGEFYMSYDYFRLLTFDVRRFSLN
jgi:C1A family cysteine protease